MFNTSHRLSRTAAGALTALAFVAPTAVAREADVYRGNATPPVPPPAPSVTTIDDGFDWDSAAIGAGGAAAVLVLAMSGASAASHRHHWRRVT
jgi:uncharacterized membrane protein YdfJ with MMPL/SSD domain